MVNEEISKIFTRIACFLEMERVPFKPVAYRKAALSIRMLEEDIADIYKKGGREAIEKLPGVGESISEKIIEFLKTGKVKLYERYRKKYPIDIDALVSVEGIGCKTAKRLYDCLKIRNLIDLEKAARAGKIRKLIDFGAKSEKNILQSIKFAKKRKDKFLLGEILPQAEEIKKRLSVLKTVAKVDICGSLRRMKEVIGDVDILLCLKEMPLKQRSREARKVMDVFCSLPEVSKVWEKGKTKSSVRMRQGFDVDLRIVPASSYGAALQYFTGSREHNIRLRRLAAEKGFKLNEYGLFKKIKAIAGETEEGIYRKLSLACPPPEIRENKGEIEAALQKNLPKLIELADIKGDLHCHSNWNGGEDSIEEMARTAIALGYDYLGISDHTKFLKIENGLDEKQLKTQAKEIESLNYKFEKQNIKFRVIHGAETNILNNGSLDISERCLSGLDYVIAGVHSNLKMSKQKMTERIIKAMKNPYVKIISHPTGRLLNKRAAYLLDMGKLFRAAKETKTALEINSFPQRLDLNGGNIREAIKAGVKLAINSDAHCRLHLSFMRYGVATARRGWSAKENIINSWSLPKLLKFFKEQ